VHCRVLGSTVVPFTWNWLVDKVEYDQDPVWEIELAFVVEVAGRIEAAGVKLQPAWMRFSQSVVQP